MFFCSTGAAAGLGRTRGTQRLGCKAFTDQTGQRPGEFVDGIFCKLMEPENQNHLFEKENHLKRTFIFGFHVNFQGCIH